MIIYSMKPKAYSLRLSCTYYKCVSRQVSQPGGEIGSQLPIANSCSAATPGRTLWDVTQRESPQTVVLRCRRFEPSRPGLADGHQRHLCAALDLIDSGRPFTPYNFPPLKAPIVRWVLFFDFGIRLPRARWSILK